MHVAHSTIGRLLAIVALVPAVLAAAVLGAPAAGADPAPPRVVAPITVTAPAISALQVRAGGTEAAVTFTTAEPTAVSFEVKPAAAAAPAPATAGPSVRPLDAVRAPLAGESVATTGGVPTLVAYRTAHELSLKNLRSNTAYDVFVTATTQTGQRHATQARFTTLPQRVRFTLETIVVEDDGDLIGKGEPLWFVKPIWDGATYANSRYDGALCYPNSFGRCEVEAFGETTITPRNSKGAPMTIVFAEENFDDFPETIALEVTAKEDDGWAGGIAGIVECVSNGGCTVGEGAPFTFTVPKGVESVSRRVTLRGDDTRTGFESKLTFHIEVFHGGGSFPWHTRNLPSNTWFVGR